MRERKLAKRSQRVKTMTSDRVYAGFVRYIDLLAGEFCESQEFRSTSNLGFFVLNPVN